MLDIDDFLSWFWEFYGIGQTMQWDEPHPAKCIWEMNFLVDIYMVNDVLGVPNVFNIEHKEKLMEINLK